VARKNTQFTFHARQPNLIHLGFQNPSVPGHDFKM
jgi:hypothetical protein